MAVEKKLAPARRIRASVTLVSLCLTTAIGIALTSYLALCTRSGQFSTRLLQQDRARELAQVGLEEALWALNQNSWSASGPDGTTAWAVSGANRTTTLAYTFSGQGGTGQIALTVANYASAGPTWPTVTSAATLTLPSGETFTKTLQATTTPAPLFGNAIASSDSYVSFVAAGTVDSWNSDPDNNTATAAVPYSFTAGNPSNYAAVVAGKDNGTYGVVLTQATVRGYVATLGQPVSYATSGSPAGSVIGPTTPVGVKVDTTRLGKSAFLPGSSVFAVSLPSTAGANFGGLLSGILDLVLALLGIPPGVDTYKTTGNLTITGGLLNPSVTISRPLKLIVNGDLSITGTGHITITATGSLDLFITDDVVIDGNGFRNLTQDPSKLRIFCTGTSTTDSVQYTTPDSFCGVIFSENKPIDIRQNATFEGALLSRQYVRFSTGATAPIFHYDTALRQMRFNHVSTPYLVKQITEP